MNYFASKDYDKAKTILAKLMSDVDTLIEKTSMQQG